MDQILLGLRGGDTGWLLDPRKELCGLCGKGFLGRVVTLIPRTEPDQDNPKGGKQWNKSRDLPLLPPSHLLPGTPLVRSIQKTDGREPIIPPMQVNHLDRERQREEPEGQAEKTQNKRGQRPLEVAAPSG